MSKSSVELNQKAAGYMLSAANALQRETKQNNSQVKQPIQKTQTKQNNSQVKQHIQKTQTKTKVKSKK